MLDEADEAGDRVEDVAAVRKSDELLLAARSVLFPFDVHQVGALGN